MILFTQITIYISSVAGPTFDNLMCIVNVNNEIFINVYFRGYQVFFIFHINVIFHSSSLAIYPPTNFNDVQKCSNSFRFRQYPPTNVPFLAKQPPKI